MNRVKKVVSGAGIFIIALVMLIFFTFMSPYFLTFDNIIKVIQQASINLVIAMGMSFVITTGGIDLSVGAMVALSSVIMADLVTARGLPIPVGVLAAVLTGTLAGVANGVFVGIVRLQPFIVTLASTSFLRGLALVYTGGRPIYGLPESLLRVFSGYIGSVPAMVLWSLALAAICTLMMRKTRLGEYTLAIGGNEEAARLCGINVPAIKIFVYGLSGFLCSVGAMMLCARLGAAEPNGGQAYESHAIAAVVMGGTALSGGKANMIGTVIGAIILSLLANGLTLMNVQSFYQQVVTGVVILLAVIIDKKRSQ